LEYKRITEEEQIYPSQERTNNHALTTESLFKDCRKCNGLLGVPISYFSSHCPEQFLIIGHAHGDAGVALGLRPFPHELKKLNEGLRDGDLYRMINGKPEIPYNRIIIQRKPIKE